MKFSSNDFKTYAKPQQYQANHTNAIEDINEFVKRTYQLFAGSLLAGAVGAYVGLGFVSSMVGANGLTFTYWGAVILEFVLLIALHFAKNKTPLNLVLLFGFTFMTGFTAAPLLSFFLAKNMGYLIAEAFFLTALAFGALTIFAMNTKRDFTTMGKMLFITLIVIIGASLLNLFLHLQWLHVIITAVSVVLFSFFILYDTQKIIQGQVTSEIEAAIDLYLDFLNLFLNLLQLLGIINGDD